MKSKLLNLFWDFFSKGWTVSSLSAKSSHDTGCILNQCHNFFSISLFKESELKKKKQTTPPTDSVCSRFCPYLQKEWNDKISLGLTEASPSCRLFCCNSLSWWTLICLISFLTAVVHSPPTNKFETGAVFTKPLWGLTASHCGRAMANPLLNWVLLMLPQFWNNHC